MKVKSIVLLLTLSVSLLAGCGQKANPPAAQPPAQQTPAPNNNQNANNAPNSSNAPNATPDAVTTASIVDNAAAFQKAIGRNGTWIICLTKDITVDKDLLLEGEYKNGKKDANGKDVIQRKIALYAQDANRNITARYTLTAPRITITSPEASIQHGTFKGDVYVSVKNFQLIDTTVNGNVYFTTDEAKNTFKMDDKSKITGKQELKK